MKKWLIRCLTVLAMVCLIPGIVLNVKAVEYAFTYCIQCKADKTCDILGYVWQSNADPIYHKIRIKCRTCRTENEIIYKPFSYHTGGTETPTCTTGKICRLCWSEYGILGHDWGEWTSNGDGTHTRSCTRSNCDAVDTASCTGGTADCSAKAVCAVCGKEYGEKDPDNHDLIPHEAKAPTCTEIGWNAYETCSRCDHTTYAELPALNHDFVHHAAKAPTCTEKGWDAYDTCSRFSCNYTTYQEIPALNHDLVQHEAKAPTCTEIGWDAYDTCSNCDYTTYVEIPASGHALTHHEAKAATCTEMGWSAYDACSNCDYTTAHTETPASGHTLTHHEAKAATCTEIGWDAYDTCSNCDYTTYVEIPASGHALTHHEAKAATCTEIGWDAYDTCSNCDYTTYVETPASGHALTHHEAKAATCTEIGWDAYDTCSNCDYTTYAEIPASGHVLTNYGENWGLVFCPVCGKVENDERLELLETASAAAVDGKLPEGELVARMNQRYLNLAFVYEGKLTAPAGRVKITLPSEIVQGKRLLLIAPDGTETELPFEIVGETICFTLDFTEVEIPVVLVLKPL